MADFTVDRALFESCRSALKSDEIISKNLDVKATMSGLDVGNPRIDCHVIAKGLFTIDDVLKAGIPVPDEGITDDEIRSVVGHLFDCQVARLDGHSFFQTVLACVYLNREYEIKNPKLRTLVHGFVPVLRFMEEYGRKIENPDWKLEKREPMENLLPEVDAGKIRAELDELEKDEGIRDVVRFVRFELDLEEYLRGFLDGHAPVEFVEPPKVAAKIGFVPEIHFRDLVYHTPPPAVEIRPHEESVKVFAQFLEDLKGIRAFPEFVDLRKFFSDAFDWGWTHQSALLFTRLMIVDTVFKDRDTVPSILGKKFADLLRADMRRFHVEESIFETEPFKMLEERIYWVFFKCFYAFACVPSSGQIAIGDTIMRSWGLDMRHLCLYETEATKKMTIPKVTFNDWTRLLKSPFSLWTLYLSADLVQRYIKLGIRNEIYNQLDYPFIFITLCEVYNCIKGAMERQRTVDGIYAVDSKKKKSKGGKVLALRDADVNKAIKPPSADELTIMALSEYMTGCFHYVRLLDKMGAMKLKPPLFYNAKAVYNSRIESLHHIQSVPTLDYSKFEAIYNTDNSTADQLKATVLSHFNAAKAHLKSAQAIESSPYRVSIVRSIVLNSLVMDQWKPGSTVTISFDSDFPTFKLS